MPYGMIRMLVSKKYANQSSVRHTSASVLLIRQCLQLRDQLSADVQNAQRRAAIGTSLRHSGHFFVVGSGGA